MHEHIDQGISERIGLPSRLVARTVDDDVKAAVRLICDDDTRLALARELVGPQAGQKFFVGRAEIFGEMLYEKVTAAIGGNGSARAALKGLPEQQGFSMTRHSVLVGLLVALGAGSALAQPKPPATAPAPAPAASSDPAQTTATYGDWVLRCVRPQKGPHVCEVVQSMVVKGQQQPVAQVAVGYDKAGLRFTMLVPPAISLSRGPTLGVAGTSAPHFDLAWRRCLPNGCYADVGVGPELLKALRGRTEPMQIDFKDATEREIKLPLSMHGLVPALDALAKEPR